MSDDRKALHDALVAMRHDDKNKLGVLIAEVDAITAKCRSCAETEGFKECDECERFYANSATCDISRRKCVALAKALRYCVDGLHKTHKAGKQYGGKGLNLNPTLDLDGRKAMVAEIAEELDNTLKFYDGCTRKFEADEAETMEGRSW